MIKKLANLFVAIVVVATGMLTLTPPRAEAAVNYNRLIDDSVFSSSGSMNSDQIDSFLNSFSSSCISTHHGFSASDPTGYSPSGGFTYGSAVSGGKVIYDAAQAYAINPQVLITTLQKEESLVSGDAGCSALRYSAAMGYGCPDSGTTHNYPGEGTPPSALYYINGSPVTSVSGTCVNTSAKVGFSEQVIHAAWLLKFGQQRSQGNTSWAIIKGNWDNSDDPAACYGGPMTQGNRKRCSSDSSTTYYDGYTTIDGSSVHMDTGATAALYWYTPHKSGNQHFFDLYSGWFSDPTIDHSKDIPLVGDWDGNGTDTIALKHGNQYLIDNNNDGFADSSFYYGSGSETPLVGDWDGNGTDTIALKIGNKYFINNELDGSSAFRFFYGNGSETPIVGDFDGNGTDTIGLKVGAKYFINNDLGPYSDFAFRYGSGTETPIVGDWNGDSKDTVSLKVGSKYFINNDLGPYSDFAFRYGSGTETPIVGDFDGNGTDTIGLKIGNKYFINNQLDGSSDFRFVIVD